MDRSPKTGLFGLGSTRPRVDDAAWVAPGAFVIGDVTIGAGSSIWFNAVLRGDHNAISVGRHSNIQDGAVIHVDVGLPTTVGDEVTVGHGAILHGCQLMDRAFVGMGAIVLNGATIETNGMLAAGALLTERKRIPSGDLWAGSPAKFFRKLTDAEFQHIEHSARYYSANASLFARELTTE